MSSQTENWTYAEFHAFFMLYAANTDGHITLEEERMIAPTLSAEAYAGIKAKFMDCDDAEVLDVIWSYKDQYCATQADKDKILADMEAIFKANSAYGQVEREVHHLIQRML